MCSCPLPHAPHAEHLAHAADAARAPKEGDVILHGQGGRPLRKVLRELSAVALLDREIYVTSSTDRKCFFYVFKLPEVWRRLMAVSGPYKKKLDTGEKMQWACQKGFVQAGSCYNPLNLRRFAGSTSGNTHLC